VGPTASLDTVVRIKSTSPYLELNPGHPACSLVTILTQLLQFSARVHRPLKVVAFNANDILGQCCGLNKQLHDQPDVTLLSDTY
jgi:hypothetical protein